MNGSPRSPPLTPYPGHMASSPDTVMVGCEFPEAVLSSFCSIFRRHRCSPCHEAWHGEALHGAGTAGSVACEAFAWPAVGHVQPHLAGTVPGVSW